MADPEQFLWPLRAVSKDPTNLTKLDANNNVLTSTDDVDARYVQKAGDTMTGNLVVEYDGGNERETGTVTASWGEFYDEVAAQSLVVTTISYDGAAVDGPQLGLFNGFKVTPGTLFAGSAFAIEVPASARSTSGLSVKVSSKTPPQKAGVVIDMLGATSTNPALGVVGLQVRNVASGVSNFAIHSDSVSQSLFTGPLLLRDSADLGGVRLDVDGNSTLRGDLSIVGDITSTGKAHNFAPNSIPASAISGLTSGGTVTKVSVATVDGVSGTVATDTTTPAISIKLGDITPSSVNADSITVNDLDVLGNFRSVSLEGNDTRLYTINSRGVLVGRNAATNQTLAYLTVDSADGAIEIGTASGTSVSLGALAGTPVVVSGNSYPTLRGTNGQVLTTDGAGTLSWATTLGGSATTIATATAAGQPGSVRWDEDFLYIRTATAWKKIPLAAL